jgi:hypothetical protein
VTFEIETAQHGSRNDKETLVQKKRRRRSLGASGDSKTLEQSAF